MGWKSKKKEGKESTQIPLIRSGPRQKEKSKTCQVVEDGLNMLILLNKTSSLRSLSIGYADLSCAEALLHEKDQLYQPVSPRQNLEAFHFQFLLSHTLPRAPCWPLRMASTDRGVPKGFSSQECAWNWLAKLLASIFWAIYCCSEVFQVSTCFRCNCWYILGTLLQRTGNDGLYPSDDRVLGGKGMWARMAPQMCQRHTVNYLPKHSTKYFCSL